MLAASILSIIKLYVKGSNEQKEAVAEIEKLVIQNLHQLSIADSKSKWRFVAFVRPFFGWVVGISFAYILLVGPIIEAHFGIPMADVDEKAIWAASSLFGIHQGTRTFEKAKGISR